LKQACYDEGTFVVFGSAQNPQQGGKAPLKALQLGGNHLDFRDFGDVIGIMQVRPAAACSAAWLQQHKQRCACYFGWQTAYV
jgi:hypothetical protein